MTNFQECVDAGGTVIQSYPAQCRTPDGRTFVEDIGNAAEKRDLIRVTAPQPNQTVSSPLQVEGEARGTWYFEATFPIRLEDSSGLTIASGYAEAEGEWMTEEFVPFRSTLEFTATPTSRFGLLTLEKANPSGLPENADALLIPVVFAADETLSLSVYFSNTARQPANDFDCSVMYPVRRTVPATATAARAALDELLKGPTTQEKAAGYATSINIGVGIRSFKVENGVATVDFNRQLEEGVGGSCRVQAIRAQINETLGQFPEIREVVISVDGRVDDVLQP